jgi:hypothetical protein
MKTKTILVSLFTLLIISSCKNKVKQNSSIIDQETLRPMIPIKIVEEIKHHLEDQKRIQSDEDDDDEIIKNPYKRNSRDLELASIVMLEGLKNNGFNLVSDEIFNERIKEIFRIDNLKNPYYKIHVADNHITLFGQQKEDYNFLIRNEFEGTTY